jgi:hypothetical protein
VLSGLHSLRELEVHGMAVDVGEIVRCAQVEALVLVDTPPFDIAALACAPRLRELTIAHVFRPQLTLRTLPNLARLELRDMRLSHVPDLAHNAALEVIVLRNIRELRDLAPLASAGALRQLEISGCPQLNVEDFRPLCAHANLRRVQVDLGSRRKVREVYRLLHLGKRHT